MRGYLVALILLLPLSFLQAQHVSFDIPETHEKFQLLDSMYKAADTLDKKAEALAQKVIRIKRVRAADFRVKEHYFDSVLARKNADTAGVRDYLHASLAYYESLEAHFKELYTALEGNNRAACMNALKQVRATRGAVNNLISKYEPVESPSVHPGRLQLDME